MSKVYWRKDTENWWITYSVNGKRKRCFGGESKKTAEARLVALDHALMMGEHFPDRKTTGTTLGQARDAWFEHSAKKKSLNSDTGRFKRIAAELGEDTLVSAIENADVRRMANAIEERKSYGKGRSSPATVNRHLVLLCSVLRLAKKSGCRVHVTEYPMREELNSRDRTFTEEELAKLTGAADPELRLAIILAAETAMRCGEIAALTWDRVNLRDRIVKLGDGDVKNKRGRRVPLTEAATAALLAWPRDINGGKLFKSTSGNFSHRFAELRMRLGILDCRFHDLRHHRISMISRANKNIMDVAAISGHRDLASLRRYISHSEADLRAIADRAAVSK